MKGKVIALFGIDGAGKTSVAMELLENLTANGQPAIYARPKFGLHLWSARCESKTPPLTNSLGHVNSYLSHTLRHMRLLFLMAEHLVDIFRRVWIPLRQGKIVIVDRYWPDTIVDLVVDFAVPYDNAKRIAFLAGLGAESAHVLLDVPSRIAMARKPGPYSLEYLERREVVYRRLAQEIGAILVSTEVDMENTLRMIRPLVLNVEDGI